MRARDADKQLLVKQKAIELLVTDGFEGFSINKLARACGISVGTIYIYYKVRDDLIIQVALEEAQRLTAEIMEDFNPELPFAEGIRQQWRTRSRQLLNNPLSVVFLEQLRTSSYHDKVHPVIVGQFKEPMGRFMHNAINRGEIDPLPLEVFWSVAYAPMYNLVRFHHEGKNMAGQVFKLTNQILMQACELVIKGLTK